MADKTDKEVMHWADQVAEKVRERVERNPQLKAIVEKQGYLIYDEKTPSGKIHVGSGRGWMIHDVIAKAMRDKGMNARFVLSSDDMDPFDKMNADLPKEYEQYLGAPFRNIPSLVQGYKSFGDYYFTQCVEKFAEYDIVADIESTGDLYVNGAFNPTIKIALDHAEKIQAIYARLYGDDSVGAKRLPFNPICDKCGKIGTTVALKWDPAKEQVYYECQQDFVPWAKGCGHTGWKSPYNGGGKFPWKVEWAAKWPTKGVICEFAGKDHFTKGGSRTCANAIAIEVFNYPSPYPSEGYKTGDGYEFFTIGGAKMSTSKGKGIGFVDMGEYVPPKILRYMLVRSRPHAVIDFDPYGTNDLILLYERYDQAERIYFGIEAASEQDVQKQKRIYELSHIGEIPKKMPLQIALGHASFVIQIGLTEDGAIDILKKTGHVPEGISEEDLMPVRERLRFAKNWVENFASDDYKFTVQTHVPESLRAIIQTPERTALHNVAAYVKEHQHLTDKELHDYFYQNARDCAIEPKDFFKVAYKVLINKERGPKLAAFVLSLGEQAVTLFESV